MAEGCGHHLLAAGPDHRPRLPVLHPGLDGVLLDPRQRPADRPVVRVHDPLVASHQRHERHRLGRGQRHVPARTVLDVAVEVLAAELASAGNLALEDGPECIGVDRAGEPEFLRAPARPGARFPCGQGRPSCSTRLSRSSWPPATERRSCRSTLPRPPFPATHASRCSYGVHAAGILASGAGNKVRMTRLSGVAANGGECLLAGGCPAGLTERDDVVPPQWRCVTGPGSAIRSTDELRHRVAKWGTSGAKAACGGLGGYGKQERRALLRDLSEELWRLDERVKREAVKRAENIQRIYFDAPFTR